MRLAIALFVFLLLPYTAVAMDIPPSIPAQDELPPLHPTPPPDARAGLDPAAPGAAALLEDAVINIRSMYYGRARSVDNRNRRDDKGNLEPYDKNEIHVNALGMGVDFRSGYAWGWLGFDISGQTNLGRGHGWSEVLYHKRNNTDTSSMSLGMAALKTKFGDSELGFETRAGYTPISVGSIGSTAGINPHAYRGFESKFLFRDWELGYAWADRFRNDWDNTFRRMTNSWGQGRFGDATRKVSFIHTIGLRRNFGLDNAGFVDLGVGEGRHYRQNTQLAASVPIDVGQWGVLTFTGYTQVARYTGNGPRENLRTGRADDRTTEYHVSGLASLKTGDLTLSTGLGHTRAPNSDEYQFRLTAWANSDNRNFIQTWGQLDDYVWDGQNVFKAAARYDLGNVLPCLPGLSVGASYLYGWNAANRGSGDSTNWEVVYYAEYAFKEGWADGLAVGVYAAHLRYSHNTFHGKQDRNDVKLIISYSRLLENVFKRR